MNVLAKKQLNLLIHLAKADGKFDKRPVRDDLLARDRRQRGK
jgi:hypothetical protein